MLHKLLIHLAHKDYLLIARDKMVYGRLFQRFAKKNPFNLTFCHNSCLKNWLIWWRIYVWQKLTRRSPKIDLVFFSVVLHCFENELPLSLGINDCEVTWINDLSLISLLLIKFLTCTWQNQVYVFSRMHVTQDFTRLGSRSVGRSMGPLVDTAFAFAAISGRISHLCSCAAARDWFCRVSGLVSLHIE